MEEAIKIIHENSEGEITFLKLRRKVTISGNGSAVTLPKKMIGKIVEIIYKK